MHKYKVILAFQINVLFFFMALASFGQSYSKLQSGSATTLNSTVSSSSVYYGDGNLILKPSFNFKGTNGIFFASTVANPVQLNSIELFSPTELRLNFTNTGAFVYVARLQEVGTPIIVETNLETNSANINSVGFVHVSGLKPNTQYACTLQAYGGAANLNSSNSITVRTPACNLSIPTIIIPISVTAGSATARWFSVLDNNGNTITYEATLTGFNTNRTISDIPNATFTFADLEPNTIYNLNVIAKSTSGCSSPAGSAIFITLSIETPIISPIYFSPNTPSVSYFVTVQWSQVIGATSYTVRSSKGLNSLIPGNGSTSSFIQESCQQSDQIVTYQVKANSARSETPWSDPAQVTLPRCPPPPGGRIDVITGDINFPKQEDNGKDELQVFPNPASKELIVEVSRRVDKEASVFFVNSIGESQKMGAISVGEMKTTVDLQTISRGIYFIRIQDKNATKKILVF